MYAKIPVIGFEIVQVATAISLGSWDHEIHCGQKQIGTNTDPLQLKHRMYKYHRRHYPALDGCSCSNH